MKKVLIISYYWPPSGGPGVQRMLKFVKYLPEFDWQPYVLTPRYGEFPALDFSLIDEIPIECHVTKTKIWEPNTFYKFLTGMKQDKAIPTAILAETENLSFTKRIAHWL